MSVEEFETEREYYLKNFENLVQESLYLLLWKQNASNGVWMSGIMGVVIGDALGVSVEFCSREELKSDPVKDMRGPLELGYPRGTWSDDSSMTLATLDSIHQNGKLDYYDIMTRFDKWEAKGEYTPFGVSFGKGATCLEAICDFADHHDINKCGRSDEWSNGNGSLMRIMPVCLYTHIKEQNREITLEEAVVQVHKASALTHNHMRSKIACGIY